MKSKITKERTHLFAPSINIAVLVSLIGTIEDSILQATIQSAVLNNEVLNCKITLDNNGEAFYEENAPKPVVLQTFHENWEEKVIEQEKNAFDLENGELIRFFVKRDNEKTHLLIIAHHLVGDGLAMTYFVEDIFNSLNGNPIEFKKLELHDMDSVPSNSSLNPLMRIMLSNTNKKWNKTGKIFSFSEYKSMYQKYWSYRESKILSVKMEEKQLDIIEKESKLHHVTINSVLATVLAKAAGEQIEIGIPVSLREKNNRSMANHSTAISIQYKYDEEKDFWSNANNVHSLIYKKLADSKSKFFLTQFMNNLSSTLIDSAYFVAFDGYTNKVAQSICKMFGYDKTPKAVHLSNLTKIEISQNNAKYKIDDFFFVPPIVPNASCMIGVATYQKQMVVTLHTLVDEHIGQKTKFFKSALEQLYKSN